MENYIIYLEKLRINNEKKHKQSGSEIIFLIKNIKNKWKIRNGR